MARFAAVPMLSTDTAGDVPAGRQLSDIARFDGRHYPKTCRAIGLSR
jgi:hypothetical protein